MSILRLPIDASFPNYRVTITLESVPYIFDVRWNQRDLAWYFDISDITEVPIKNGIKIVLGKDLGGPCADPRWPKGFFLAEDLSNQGKDATIDDLGSRVVVDYFTSDELASL